MTSSVVRGAAVLEHHARAQLDAPGGGIDVGPGFRKRRRHLEVRIRFDQAIEDLSGDVLVVAGARELRIERRRLRRAAEDDIGRERRRHGDEACQPMRQGQGVLRWDDGFMAFSFWVQMRGDCRFGMSRLIVVEMAGADMARRDLPQLRRLARHRSNACGQRGWKWQPLGGASGDGISPLIGEKTRRRLAMRGHLVEERHRVGMVRPREEGVRRSALDDAAEIHDRDAVADMLHHAEIVADEEIGQAEIALQLHEQIDDLRLDRDVERRDGFIADDELRLDRERPGNPDPLPLAARELVRIAARDRMDRGRPAPSWPPRRHPSRGAGRCRGRPAPRR